MKITVGPTNNVVFQPATDRGTSAKISIGSGGGEGGATSVLAYNQANAARGQANTAYGQANAAYGQANAAYTAANNAKVTVFANNASNVTTQNINFINTSTISVEVTSSGSNANIAFNALGGAAYDQANAARDQANTAYSQANNSRTQANSARDQANTARTTANDAYGQANSAYNSSNNRVLKAGDTMTGILNVASTIISQNIIPNLNVTYDLGNTTNRFNDLYLGGNTVYIGDAVLSTNGDTVLTNTFVAELSFVSGGLNVLNQANSAYDKANAATTDAQNAYGQANAAYNQANSARLQANNAYAEANLKLNLTGGTINGSLNVSGNLTITGNTSYINVTTLNVTDPLIFLASNNDTSDVVDIGFVGAKKTGATVTHTGLARDAGDGTYYLFDNLADSGHENNIIDFANSTLAILRANIAANSITLVGETVATHANLILAYTQANNARDQANTARNQANTARTTANDAYGAANSSQTNALNAYGQANNARDQANTARTTANDAYGQANTARDQANTARDQANTARTQANNSYAAANSAANTARVSANSGSTLSAKQLNFNNTASITVTVESAGDGTNANISFATTGASVSDAYNQANSARDQANTARGQANTARDQANTARTTANDAYGAANSAANTARVSANSGSTLSAKQLNFNNSGSILVTIESAGDGTNANISFVTSGASAGDAYNQANSARDQANTAYGQANAARGQANTARDTANAAYGQANDAYGQANTARNTANSAYGQANNAYDKANSATVRITANTGSSVTTPNINFINTSTVTVSVVSGDNGNANVSFASSGGATQYTYDTTTTSAETVDSWSATTYRSGKYQMQIENASGFAALDITLLHDGATTNLIKFGESTFGSSVGTFSSDINSGLVRLRFTANDPTSALTYYRSLLAARGAESLPTDLMTGSANYDLMNNIPLSPTDLNA